jgi:hypothetical protein
MRWLTADEERAHRFLHISLSTNEDRVELFRQLALYEHTNGYERWCEVTGQRDDPDVHAEWSLLHWTYIVAWRELGSDMFWRYLRLGYMGMNLGRAT